MDKLIFAVYDSKAEVYGNPFFCRTKGEALRSFIQIANEKDSAIGAHPEDYDLFCIGSYNEFKGIVVPAKSNEHLGKAVNFVKEVK